MNTNLKYVRGQAKKQAQLTQQNQVVYETYYKKTRTYKFSPEPGFRGAIVEVVRYTPEVERGNVLSDNGIGGKRTIDSPNEPTVDFVKNLDVDAELEDSKKTAKKTKREATDKTKRKTE